MDESGVYGTRVELMGAALGTDKGLCFRMEGTGGAQLMCKMETKSKGAVKVKRPGLVTPGCEGEGSARNKTSKRRGEAHF